MLKRIAIGSAALAALMVGPSQLAAQPGSAEVIVEYYFSDATHTTQVGYISLQYCTYSEFDFNGVQYQLHGTRTAYSYYEVVGYCQGGDFYPN